MAEPIVTHVRNAVIAFGAYYLGTWVEWPVSAALGRLTDGMTFEGNFGLLVLMPLVGALPAIVGAFGAGALVGLVALSNRRWRWALIPAAVDILFRIGFSRWVTEPTPTDRIVHAIEGVLPAVAFVSAAMLVERWTQSRRGLRS